MSQIVSAEEWHNRAKQIQIDKKDMNQLVLNFFIIEGYRDAALQFAKETGITISEQELSKMSDRIAMKQNILNGDIDKAIQMFQNSQSSKVMFTLKIQKLIELIKLNRITEAITFAQTDLTPFLQDSPHFIDEIEKVMTLMAFEDCQQSPVNHLVQSSQRIKVASEVNTHMLAQENNGHQIAKITILMKLLQWAQRTLNTRLEYPQLVDISTGKFQRNNDDY